jgi:hypothetical protein
MIEPRHRRLSQDYETSSRAQSLELAASIDAATEDLSRNGATSRADLATLLAELEAEWETTEAKSISTKGWKRSITE